MTATPIPRTLAMSIYGDLDVSTIKELPPGRIETKTVHKYDKNRLSVFSFLKKEIKKGRQVYLVYPLINESEKLDYKDLILPKKKKESIKSRIHYRYIQILVHFIHIKNNPEKVIKKIIMNIQKYLNLIHKFLSRN